MKKTFSTAAFYLLVGVIVLYAVFPFYYAIITSLKPAGRITTVDYYLTSFTLENYRSVFKEQPFAHNIFNSVVVATSVVCLSLFLGVTAAYALARIKFKGRGLMLVTILGISMFPQVAVLSGMFQLIRGLGLYDKLLGLTLSYMLFTVPFTVWVLTTFMRELPKELEDAAIMDGATPWQIITKVFMPLMWPAMVTTGLLAFIAAWNEYVFALTFTFSDEQRTVPVAISLITGTSQYDFPFASIMAASVTVTVPVVILVLIFQRRIVSGLTAGAVKG